MLDSIFIGITGVSSHQTRMNVIAIAPHSGSLLWSKKKITNNPNAIYIDENVILGVGPGGNPCGDRSRIGWGTRRFAVSKAGLHTADGQHRFGLLPRRGNVAI